MKQGDIITFNVVPAWEHCIKAGESYEIEYAGDNYIKIRDKNGGATIINNLDLKLMNFLIKE